MHLCYRPDKYGAPGATKVWVYTNAGVRVGSCKHYLPECEAPSHENTFWRMFSSLFSQLAEASSCDSHAPPQIGITHTREQPFTYLSHLTCF